MKLKIKTMLATVVIGFAVLGGWVYAEQVELINHLQDVQKFQKLDNNPCPPSSSNPDNQ